MTFIASKVAILNGRLWNPRAQAAEIQNMLFSNGVLVGTGYIPDEDEEKIEKVDVGGALILPNVIDIGALDSNDIDPRLPQLTPLGLMGGVSHLGHFTPSESVIFPITTRTELLAIRNAKATGQTIFCGTPLTALEPSTSVNDAAAVIEALLDGTIDFIATERGEGLPVFLPMIIDILYTEHHCPLPRIIELVSGTPAKILGLTVPTIALGKSPNLTAINPERKWTASQDDLGNSSPIFLGKVFQSSVRATLQRGVLFHRMKMK